MELGMEQPSRLIQIESKHVTITSEVNYIDQIVVLCDSHGSAAAGGDDLSEIKFGAIDPEDREGARAGIDGEEERTVLTRVSAPWEPSGSVVPPLPRPWVAKRARSVSEPLAARE